MLTTTKLEKFSYNRLVSRDSNLNYMYVVFNNWITKWRLGAWDI